MREMTWPVVTAAMKPDMTAGERYAMASSGDAPRSCWRIWMK
jgi:hypothetical protein